MENKNQMTAIKSLSSLLISLLAVIGIIFTLLTYFVVSPALASLDTSSKTIFSSLVTIADSAAYNNKATSDMLSNYATLLDRMESSVGNTTAGILATRQSLMKLQALSGYNLANETIQLKNSEDSLNSLKVEIENAKSSIQNTGQDAPKIDPDLSAVVLKASNSFGVSISSLNTLFTGMTVALVILFLCMILLSAEGLLS